MSEATEHYAGVLAALPDPTLAARAADVRSVGRRLLAALAGRAAAAGGPAGPGRGRDHRRRPAQRGRCRGRGGQCGRRSDLARGDRGAVAGRTAGVRGRPGAARRGRRHRGAARPAPPARWSWRPTPGGGPRPRRRPRPRAAGGNGWRPSGTGRCAPVDGHAVEVLANVAGPADADIAVQMAVPGVGSAPDRDAVPDGAAVADGRRAPGGARTGADPAGRPAGDRADARLRRGQAAAVPRRPGSARAVAAADAGRPARRSGPRCGRCC